MSQTMPAAAGPAPRIRVRKVGAACGAEISGVDLSQALDDATFAEIEAALVEHQVIVFRDQDISTEDQKRFGRRFGELTVHPFAPSDAEAPDLIVFDNDADNPPWGTDVWHSDETFRAAPPMGTILRALIVPDYGGDTLFASMAAAYEGLSDHMQQFVSGLEAVHDFKPFRQLFDDDASVFPTRGPCQAYPAVAEQYTSENSSMRFHAIADRPCLNSWLGGNFAGPSRDSSSLCTCVSCAFACMRASRSPLREAYESSPFASIIIELGSTSNLPLKSMPFDLMLPGDV